MNAVDSVVIFCVLEHTFVPGNEIRSLTNEGLGEVLDMSVGFQHVCAVGGDGTVWCWGSNGYGQLGDGTTTLHATPVEVGF